MITARFLDARTGSCAAQGYDLSMSQWLALPTFTLIFAAPIGFAVMMLWPVWRGSGVLLFEAAEIGAMTFLTLGLSGIAATLALGQAPRARRLR